MLKDKAALITLVIFLCGYAELWVMGVTSTGHLIDNLVASYLLAWALYVFVSDLPRKEIRARFVLMTLVGAAVLGLVELPGALGIVNYQALVGNSGRTWWDRPGYVPDPQLVYRHAPHYRERGVVRRGNIGEGLCLPAHPPTSFDLRYDHNGFRNDEDRDRADVAVVGDSYVESSMLASSDLLTATLAAKLQIPVANLGVNGYGPEQELTVLKRYAVGLQPKTVVWVFFEGNDLLQLESDDDDSLETFPEAVSWRDEMWTRSLTRNLLVATSKVMRGCTPHRTYLQYRGRFQTADGQHSELFFWEKPGPLKGNDRDRLQRLRTILTEAYGLSRQHGFRLIVAFAPTSARVHYDLKNFEPSTPEMQGWVVSNLPEEFEPMLHAISPEIPFIDLTGPLREAAAAGTLTYFPDDTHWTAAGQRVVGETLYQALIDIRVVKR